MHERGGIRFSKVTGEIRDPSLTLVDDGSIHSDLSSPAQAALLRGQLLALFGEPSDVGDEYKTTFVYRVLAEADGHQALLAFRDWKSTPHRTISAVSHAFARRARDAFDELRDDTVPADFRAMFYEYTVEPYGVTNGIPWWIEEATEPRSLAPQAGSPLARKLRETADAAVVVVAIEPLPGDDPLAAAFDAFAGPTLAKLVYDFADLAPLHVAPLCTAITSMHGSFTEPVALARRLARIRDRASAIARGDARWPERSLISWELLAPRARWPDAWMQALAELEQLEALVRGAAEADRRVQLHRRPPISWFTASSSADPTDS